MNDKKTAPSEEFLEAFNNHVSTCSATCECCDRTIFNSMDGGCFDGDELKKLQDKATREPDKYIDTDSVHLGSIDGKQFVYSCPCEQESLYKYEAFVWGNRFSITEYIAKKTIRRKNELIKEYEHIKSFFEDKENER